jgi:hypothetical protein
MGHDGRARGIVASCGTWGRVTKKKFVGIWNSFEIFGRCRAFTWRVEERNGERNMYFVCDFNKGWLKDLNFLCCINVQLIVDGIIIYVIKVGCFIELIYLHFF